MKAVLITAMTCATFVVCLAIVRNVPASATVSGGTLAFAVGAAALQTGKP